MGLDLAIRRRNPGDYIEITEDIVERWREICARIHRAIAEDRARVVKEPLAAPISADPVEVDLRLSNGKIGSEADLEAMSELEDRLEEALASGGAGMVDTVETGRGYRRFAARER